MDYSSKIESGKSIEKIFDFAVDRKAKTKTEKIEIQELFQECGIKSISELKEILLKYKGNT